MMMDIFKIILDIVKKILDIFRILLDIFKIILDILEMILDIFQKVFCRALLSQACVMCFCDIQNIFFFPFSVGL